MIVCYCQTHCDYILPDTNTSKQNITSLENKFYTNIDRLKLLLYSFSLLKVKSCCNEFASCDMINRWVILWTRNILAYLHYAKINWLVFHIYQIV